MLQQDPSIEKLRLSLPESQFMRDGSQPTLFIPESQRQSQILLRETLPDEMRESLISEMDVPISNPKAIKNKSHKKPKVNLDYYREKYPHLQK